MTDDKEKPFAEVVKLKYPEGEFYFLMVGSICTIGNEQFDTRVVYSNGYLQDYADKINLAHAKALSQAREDGAAWMREKAAHVSFEHEEGETVKTNFVGFKIAIKIRSLPLPSEEEAKL